MPSEGIHAVIVGAGKIGRGFIAHLLDLAGVQITFVEQNAQMVADLGVQGSYQIHITGNAGKDYVVSGFDLLSTANAAQVSVRIAQADLVMTAVGGARVASLGDLLAPGIEARYAKNGRVLNIITCENWIHPAQTLRDAIAVHLSPGAREYFGTRCGVAESTVLRSCFEPTPEQRAADPYAVQAQDYWELQVDADHLVLPFPAIEGIVPTPHFQSALQRKLYTYNAASATMSFLGALVGYRYLHEAAEDPRILSITRTVLQESGDAVCRCYDYTPEEQHAFADAAIAKYQNRAILDTLERNVRDPIRKLGRHDRLVGAACLCLEEGIEPVALALAIAAGLRYHEPSDPAAVTLQERLRREGIDTVLTDVCGIDPTGVLARLIKAQVVNVDRFVAGEALD